MSLSFIFYARPRSLLSILHIVLSTLTTMNSDMLTQIADYFYRHNASDVAAKVLELPEFNSHAKLYLEIKHQVANLLSETTEISDNIVELVIDKLRYISDTTDIEQTVRLSIVTIRFLEEMYINADKEAAFALLTTIPPQTTLSMRQNLSSLILQKDTPHTFLSSLGWVNIKSIDDARALLVESIFKLIPKDYIPQDTLTKTAFDAASYRQLSCPRFGINSDGSGLPTNRKHKLVNHSDEVWFIRYSPDGRYLATGSKDRKVIVYDATRSYAVTAVFHLHTESITYISWNAMSTKILTLSFDQTLRIWSVFDKKCIKEFDNRTAGFTQARLSSACFSPDTQSGDLIFIASNDGKLFSINERTGNIVSEYTGKTRPPQIHDFVIHNSKIWAITIDNDLLILDLHTLALIHKMKFDHQPLAISVVPKSFPGYQPHKLESDDTTTSNHLLINLKPNSLVLINAAGIASPTSTHPYIETFFHMPAITKNSYILRGCAGGNYRPNSATPSSGLVLSGGQNGEIWMWGSQGNVVGCIDEHDGLVNCVSWRNDGFAPGDDVEWASGSDDGTVCVWSCV